MCNQMLTSEIREEFHARSGEGNYKDLDKTRVKLLPNFTGQHLITYTYSRAATTKKFVTKSVLEAQLWDLSFCL